MEGPGRRPKILKTTLDITVKKILETSDVMFSLSRSLIEAHLTEAVMRWKAPWVDMNDTYIVIFRGHYWLLGGYFDKGRIPEEVSRDIADHLGLSKEYADAAEDFSNFLSFYWESEIDYERPDVYVGKVYNGSLYISGDNVACPDPVTSSMLRKVVAELNLDGVHFDQPCEYEDFTPVDKMLGGLPDVLYHGTSSHHMKSIALGGITPNNPTNWSVAHPGLIFGATRPAMVMLHANRTYKKAGDPGFVVFPVILEFKVPDKNRIVPDFDVASVVVGRTSMTDRLGYSRQFRADSDDDFPDVRKHNPEGRLWKSAGRFGYKGRVPASFITKVFTTFDPDVMQNTKWWEGSLKEFFTEWKRRGI